MPRRDQCEHCPLKYVDETYDPYLRGSRLFPKEVGDAVINLTVQLGLRQEPESDAPDCHKYEHCRRGAIRRLDNVTPASRVTELDWRQFKMLNRVLPPRPDSDRRDEIRYAAIKYPNIGAAAIISTQETGIFDERVLIEKTMQTQADAEAYSDLINNGGLEALQWRATVRRMETTGENIYQVPGGVDALENLFHPESGDRD